MAGKDQKRRIAGVGRRIEEALLRNKHDGVEPATQTALAQLSGISRQTLSTILASDEITPHTAHDIALALGMTIDELAPDFFTSSERDETKRAFDRPAIRARLREFRLNMATIGATGAEIAAAEKLLTSPDAMVYYKSAAPVGLPPDLLEKLLLANISMLSAVLIEQGIKQQKRAEGVDWTGPLEEAGQEHAGRAAYIRIAREVAKRVGLTVPADLGQQLIGIMPLEAAREEAVQILRAVWIVLADQIPQRTSELLAQIDGFVAMVRAAVNKLETNKDVRDYLDEMAESLISGAEDYALGRGILPFGSAWTPKPEPTDASVPQPTAKSDVRKKKRG